MNFFKEPWISLVVVLAILFSSLYVNCTYANDMNVFQQILAANAKKEAAAKKAKEEAAAAKLKEQTLAAQTKPIAEKRALTQPDIVPDVFRVKASGFIVIKHADEKKPRIYVLGIDRGLFNLIEKEFGTDETHILVDVMFKENKSKK